MASLVAAPLPRLPIDPPQPRERILGSGHEIDPVHRMPERIKAEKPAARRGFGIDLFKGFAHDALGLLAAIKTGQRKIELFREPDQQIRQSLGLTRLLKRPVQRRDGLIGSSFLVGMVAPTRGRRELYACGNGCYGRIAPGCRVQQQRCSASASSGRSCRSSWARNDVYSSTAGCDRACPSARPACSSSRAMQDFG